MDFWWNTRTIEVKGFSLYVVLPITWFSPNIDWTSEVPWHSCCLDTYDGPDRGLNGRRAVFKGNATIWPRSAGE